MEPQLRPTIEPQLGPTPPSQLRPLIEPRLVIVTGKGGTGKTTVAASLALAAARAGRRALLAEVGRDEEVPRLFAPDAPDCGYEGRELAPGLRGMRIDPFSSLAEYLGIQLGVGALARWVVDNNAFRQLMNAAPGWRELITLGKVWHLEQMSDRSGEASIDLIVVDAPATGHGLTFLDVPHVVVSAVRSGPLRRHSEQVEALLQDAERTLLLPVALPEELPVRETAELVDRLRDQTGIAVDRVIANAVAPEPFGSDSDALAQALQEAAKNDAQSALAGLAACVRHANARRALHEQHLDDLAERTQLPVIPLPLLPPLQPGGSALPRLETLAALLAAESTSR